MKSEEALTFDGPNLDRQPASVLRDEGGSSEKRQGRRKAADHVEAYDKPLALEWITRTAANGCPLHASYTVKKAQLRQSTPVRVDCKSYQC